MNKTVKKVIGWTAMTLYFFEAFSYLTMMPVYAYIDPSAVTYIIQAVAGVFIAIGAVLTIFRHKILALFKKNKDVEKKEVHFKDDSND